MTYEEARRRLKATTRFELRDGRVWLREIRWLRAAEDLDRAPATAEAFASSRGSLPQGVHAAAH